MGTIGNKSDVDEAQFVQMQAKGSVSKNPRWNHEETPQVGVWTIVCPLNCIPEGNQKGFDDPEAIGHRRSEQERIEFVLRLKLEVDGRRQSRKIGEQNLVKGQVAL